MVLKEIQTKPDDLVIYFSRGIERKYGKSNNWFTDGFKRDSNKTGWFILIEFLRGIQKKYSKLWEI